MLLRFDWRMALLVTGALPFIIIGSVIYYKTVTGAESGSDKLFAKANQAVADAFGSIRVVQAYNLNEKVGALQGGVNMWVWALTCGSGCGLGVGCMLQEKMLP